MRRSLALALLAAIALSTVGLPSPASPQSSGRVYLVPLGPGVPVPLRELADHYRQTYKLNVIVLPELVLGDPRVQDTTRFQLVADKLLGHEIDRLGATLTRIDDDVLGAPDFSEGLAYLRPRLSASSRTRCQRRE